MAVVEPSKVRLGGQEPLKYRGSHAKQEGKQNVCTIPNNERRVHSSERPDIWYRLYIRYCQMLTVPT